MIRDRVRVDEFSYIVHPNVFQKFLIVAVLEIRLVALLLFFEFQQGFFDFRDQGHRALACRVLHDILLDEQRLPVYARLNDGRIERERVFVEVDGLPFHAAKLTSPQTVKRCHLIHKLVLVAFQILEKGFELFEVVILRFVFRAFRLFHFRGGIDGNEVCPIRDFERTPNDDVIVRTRLYLLAMV